MTAVPTTLRVSVSAAVAALAATVALVGCRGSSSSNSPPMVGTAAYAWGAATGSPEPQSIVLPPRTTTVALGRHGRLALADERAWAMPAGESDWQPVHLPNPTHVTAIAVGDDFFLVAADGHAYAWGANSVGQLGDGTRQSHQLPLPVRVPGTVTQVSAGARFAVARTADGAVYGWGSDAEGQLGDGQTVDRPTPARVPLPDGATVTAVSAGARAVLARTEDGHVLAWGSNVTGQLGAGTPGATAVRPVRLPLEHVSAVSAGSTFGIAVDSDGTVWSWGSNSDGQLGTGTAATTALPHRVPLDAPVATVAAADLFAAARTRDGRVYAWGDGSFGQLGDGTTQDRYAPVAVALPAATEVSAVAVGPGTTLALPEPARVGRLSLIPAANATASGRSVAMRVNAFDALGRPLGPVATADVELRMAKGTCTAGSCTPNGTGLHEVVATVRGVTGRPAATFVVVGTLTRTSDLPTFRVTTPPGARDWVALAVLLAGGVGILLVALILLIRSSTRHRRNAADVTS